jgi:hypothetical protein
MPDTLAVQVLQKLMPIVPPPLQGDEERTGRKDNLPAIEQQVFDGRPVGRRKESPPGDFSYLFNGVAHDAPKVRGIGRTANLAQFPLNGLKMISGYGRHGRLSFWPAMSLCRLAYSLTKSSRTSKVPVSFCIFKK